jgi:hypothetical protein
MTETVLNLSPLASAKLRPVESPTRESRRVYVSAVLIYRRGYVSKVADTASACEALSITRASLPSTPLRDGRE